MVAVVVLPDTIALGVYVTQSVFGQPAGMIAEVMGIDEPSPYEVVLCGNATRHVLPSGIDFGELAPLDVARDADTVVVAGVVEPMKPRDEELINVLRDAYQGGARLVSTCSGAFVLAQAGLLDGRTATTHWLLAAEFRQAFPGVRLDVDRLYVDDGRVHTSAGRMAALDLALHLLALDRGQAAANDVGRILVSAPQRSGGQAQFVKDSLRADATTSMEPLLQWLRENLEQPITLAQVAAHGHMSERTLARKFRAATGTTVFDWLIRERINRAKVLLETTDFTIGEVAAMAGFGSTEALRRHFDKAVGTTAGAYRRTFRSSAANEAAS
ncbi:GlxA family transcriptional regulator [Mycolicibacterium madagascariense]|uniref:GlxA family transcriptional regulator n=1 Tax=Mycolicibacterium madagascariense TaxID=212765 RepID=UPI0013D55746|nr:helix-turn-helix domain-containing protein [Mycolicibacterium madagascariense]